MNIKQKVIGGLAAIAVAGCGHALKELKKDDRLTYTVQSNGLLVPTLGGFKEHTFRIVGDNTIGIRFFDRNYDGTRDMVEIEVYKKGDSPSSGPSERYLLVDTEKYKFDNEVDLVYFDTKDIDSKSDRVYESVIDATLFYQLNSGGEILPYPDRGLYSFTAKVVVLLEKELKKETK